ncbi:MAG: hypothetical protein DRR16_10900 [Candidatus Parabeggiatoa sp. nov. 3]|nr:MAG: hypothetical protein DRR00_11290 [Gammaproteobacteria bacterium]RKZ66678.1 MAG: hypothetical protein DRQ99_08970 [Gammaproteobacteria bacterium]RKZ85938.1 MAG: hypothetical protein DRR16_10900 [Gammaproteobacteria bacterium]
MLNKFCERLIVKKIFYFQAPHQAENLNLKRKLISASFEKSMLHSHSLMDKLNFETMPVMIK